MHLSGGRIDPKGTSMELWDGMEHKKGGLPLLPPGLVSSPSLY
ncbi:MAG: hypothetical protein NW226_23365 [Microscillaceae bacterium]|nr:hypothetical protein [Microscillaceae bacterium]